MVKKNKAVKEEIKENIESMESIGVMPPLPDNCLNNDTQEVSVSESDKHIGEEEKTVKSEIKENKANKKYYAFCRISGGLLVQIKNEYGEITNKILKSGNTSRLAADGTRIFELKPDTFGITELSEEEYKQAKQALEPMKCYKKGFVFLVDDLAKGEQMAKEQVAKYPTQGTEQLSGNGLGQAKEVSTFSE